VECLKGIDFCGWGELGSSLPREVARPTLEFHPNSLGESEQRLLKFYE
jgi:hypothetical protein